MTLTLSLTKVIKCLSTKKTKRNSQKFFICLFKNSLITLSLHKATHTFFFVILTAKRLQILTSSGKIFHCSCALGHPFPARPSDHRKLLLQPVLPVQLHGHDPALPLIVLVMRQSRVMREPPGTFNSISAPSTSMYSASAVISLPFRASSRLLKVVSPVSGLKWLNLALLNKRTSWISSKRLVFGSFNI